MEDPGKSSIAIIIPGGIGTGYNNIGVPVLERIIKLLSREFNLTVFQLFSANKDFKVEGFEFIEVHSSSALLRSMKFFWAFLKMERKRKFKAIHGYWILPCGFLAVLTGKFFGIRSIVSVLGGDAISLPEINYGQLRGPYHRYLTRWTIRNADRANALTQYLKENLKAAGVVRRDIKIIPWGIDTTQFAFKIKPLKDPIQFLHIANLHPVKDQETLLKAFRIIAGSISAHLTIIGEGISAGRIRSMISQFNLQEKVTILGLLPYDQLPDYYHSADILLHTSLSEGQSEVVTEAMSCGVLVCGTKVGLMYDLPNCCTSVPVGNHLLLATETLELIRDPSRSDLQRNLAHRWTTEHTMEWTVDQIMECYKNAP